MCFCSSLVGRESSELLTVIQKIKDAESLKPKKIIVPENKTGPQRRQVTKMVKANLVEDDPEEMVFDITMPKVSIVEKVLLQI